MARGVPAGLHVVEHHPRVPVGGTPPVVLVHGSLDRSASFVRVVRRLDDLEVVRFDRRGYAHSLGARPGAAGLELHVADLLAVVGDHPAAVVGHSFGGLVVIAAALAEPGRLAAIGAYEPPLSWMPWWRHNRPPAAVDGGESDPGGAAEAFFRRMVGDGAWDRLPEATRAHRRAEGPALVAELASIGAPGPGLDFTRLAVPAVFARGERAAPRYRRAVDLLADTVPGAERMVVAGAGHGAHLSHPGAFAELVRRVVARATPGAPGDPGTR